MIRKKRIILGLTVLLTLLIGIPAIRFCRYVQQAHKNQELIAAIKAGNEQKALQILVQGADGGARDTGKPVSMGEFLLLLFNREPKEEGGEKHYAAIVLLYQQAYGGRSPRHKPDPKLVKALLDHGAYLNEQDKDADSYLMAFGKRTVEPLYQRAEAANPTSPVWSEKLGQLYSFDMSRENGDSRQKSATSSLAAYERALSHIKSAEEHTMILSYAATAAFEAGQIEKAHTYAEEMLKVAADPSSPNFKDGDAIHQGHIILGRIALHNGNLVEAKAQLLASGRGVDSPVLGSFGPDMTLAKELLEKGERKTVLEYFKLCGNFWQDSWLNIWAKEVQAGKIPNFHN